MNKKYILVVGTRPNFVKAAALFAGKKAYPGIEFTLVHTGQHSDTLMSKVFFDEMQVPAPDITLTISATDPSERLGKMINELTRTFQSLRSAHHGVIVVGDVNSTLAGALAASRAQLPLIHVEAGLRSNDVRMPEETNRIIIDHISDLLFVSESEARNHLLREGIDETRIYDAGSLMVESLERLLPAIKMMRAPMPDLAAPYYVATIHRVENVERPETLKQILSVINTIARTKTVVLPLHPGTRKRIEAYNLFSELSSVRVIEPLGYIEFLSLVTRSAGVITDSGGIQEETTHLGIPCATLRDTTERPSTLTLGSNKLFPTHELTEQSPELIRKHLETAGFSKAPVPLWDAQVSDRVLSVLSNYEG